MVNKGTSSYFRDLLRGSICAVGFTKPKLCYTSTSRGGHRKQGIFVNRPYVCLWLPRSYSFFHLAITNKSTELNLYIYCTYIKKNKDGSERKKSDQSYKAVFKNKSKMFKFPSPKS